MSGKRAKQQRREQLSFDDVETSTEQREQLAHDLLAGYAARYGMSAGAIKPRLLQAHEADMSLDDWMARERASHVQRTAAAGEPVGERAERLKRRRENAERRRKERSEATHRRKRQVGKRRDRVVNIRLSEREYETLSRKAYQGQLSLSAFLVESGLNRRIRNPKRGPKPPSSYDARRADVTTNTE